jgi:hypothetical protein
MIAIENNGHLICDPLPYNQADFNARLMRLGGLPNAPEKEPGTVIDCGPLRLVPAVKRNDPPPHDLGYVASYRWQINGDVVEQVTDWQPISVSQFKDKLLNQLADIRYRHETGGIELNGAQICTERDSQAMISNAYAAMANNLISSTRFKADNGWHQFTLAELEPIAKAVATHVANAFAAEYEVASQHIEPATTFEQLAVLDLPTLYNSTLSNA